MAVRRLASDEVQPRDFTFTANMESFAAQQVAKYPEGRQASAVVPLLWHVQGEYGGWLPRRALEAVADRLGMPYMRVLEVATFYTMFNLEPVGRYFVQCCGTTPCALRGAGEIMDYLRQRVGEQRHVTPDGNFSWLEVECMGACCNAPMVQINNDYYEDLTPETLGRVMDELAAGREPKAGSQAGRSGSEPADAVSTLADPTLFDGSRIGAWRKRFEETQPAAEAKAEAEKVTTEQRIVEKGETRPAKPDSGRATERPVADAQAQRAASGQEPVRPEDQKGASDPTRATVAPAATRPEDIPARQSTKSPTPLPVNPDEGRIVAASAGTTPYAGTPPSAGLDARRDGSESEPDAERDLPDADRVAAEKLAALPKDATPEQRADAAGQRPIGMEAPRGGKSDDLTRIKGIGPGNATKLNALGIYHFDQIETWGRDEIRWVNTYLGFAGRIEREQWVRQAQALATGSDSSIMS